MPSRPRGSPTPARGERSDLTGLVRDRDWHAPATFPCERECDGPPGASSSAGDSFTPKATVDDGSARTRAPPPRTRSRCDRGAATSTPTPPRSPTPRALRPCSGSYSRPDAGPAAASIAPAHHHHHRRAIGLLRLVVVPHAIPPGTGCMPRSITDAHIGRSGSGRREPRADRRVGGCDLRPRHSGLRSGRTKRSELTGFRDRHYVDFGVGGDAGGTGAGLTALRRPFAAIGLDRGPAPQGRCPSCSDTKKAGATSHPRLWTVALGSAFWRGFTDGLFIHVDAEGTLHAANGTGIGTAHGGADVGVEHRLSQPWELRKGRIRRRWPHPRHRRT